jgi:hypothetical protein
MKRYDQYPAPCSEWAIVDLAITIKLIELAIGNLLLASDLVACICGV